MFNINKNIVDSSITHLKIKLCDCCNGTYFYFQTIHSNATNFFYLQEDELAHLLCDNYFNSFFKHCYFNIDTMQFDFIIKEFFNDKKNVDCMNEIFEFLYQQTVLGDDGY